MCVCVRRDCVCIVSEITHGPLLMVGAQYLFWNGRRKERSLITGKEEERRGLFKATSKASGDNVESQGKTKLSLLQLMAFHGLTIIESLKGISLWNTF